MIKEIKDGDKTVGYCTFIIEREDFIVEDIQIYPKFQRKGHCARFLRELLEVYGKIVLRNVKNFTAIERMVAKIKFEHGCIISFDLILNSVGLRGWKR